MENQNTEHVKIFKTIECKPCYYFLIFMFLIFLYEISQKLYFSSILIFCSMLLILAFIWKRNSLLKIHDDKIEFIDRGHSKIFKNSNIKKIHFPKNRFFGIILKIETVDGKIYANYFDSYDYYLVYSYLKTQNRVLVNSEIYEIPRINYQVDKYVGKIYEKFLLKNLVLHSVSVMFSLVFFILFVPQYIKVLNYSNDLVVYYMLDRAIATCALVSTFMLFGYAFYQSRELDKLKTKVKENTELGFGILKVNIISYQQFLVYPLTMFTFASLYFLTDVAYKVPARKFIRTQEFRKSKAVVDTKAICLRCPSAIKENDAILYVHNNKEVRTGIYRKNVKVNNDKNAIMLTDDKSGISTSVKLETIIGVIK